MNAAFNSKQFRQVLGNFPTGVVIVSGIDQSGLPQGVTIGSFTSVSLDPPLVGFSLILILHHGRRLRPVAHSV